MTHAPAAIVVDPLLVGHDDVSPVYPGADPWNIAGDLVLGGGTLGPDGIPGNIGALRIDGGSDVTNNWSRIARTFGSTGSVDITGAGSTWTSSGYLYLGEYGSGTLSIADGGGVSNLGAFLGNNPGSTGDATVAGGNSTWTNNGQLRVGEYGGGTLTIEAGGAVTNTFGIIGANAFSTGAATVTGTGSTWTNNDALHVGNSGNGTLTVGAGGTVINTAGFIGSSAGSNSAATVTGTGSTWTNNGDLQVGGSGRGTLAVEAGGAVTNFGGLIGNSTGSTGAATVTGTGSTWTNTGALRVGQNGNGTLTIGAGGAVTNNSTGYIGGFAGSTGTVRVSGADSTWTNNGFLYVGYFGAGTLTVEAEASVTSSYGYIGGFAGSTGTATVTGTGATWENTGLLFVGQNGNGSLTVEAGGAVTSSDVYISGFAGSTGTATVTGTGSTWTNTSDLYVGGNTGGAGGTGVLNVRAGGAVHVANTLKVWGTGTCLLDGGSLTAGWINVTDPTDFILSSGTFNLTSSNLVVGSLGQLGSVLNIPDAMTVNVTNLATVQPNGTLIVAGEFNSGGLSNYGAAVFIGSTIDGPVNTPAGSTVTIVGGVSFNGAVSGAGGFFGPGTATFNGGYTPGDSPATVHFEGSVSLGAGNTLAMEIGGLLAGSEFDALDIAGTLTAGGILDISLTNAFAPSAGDSFDILNFGLIFGSFNSINLPTLGGNLDWDTSNLLIDGTLTVFSTALDGDLNTDGFVGIGDLNIVLSAWNQNVTPGAWGLGDPSGDGFVGIEDLNTVLGNWNAGTPPNNGTNIPEPASLVLLLPLACTLMRNARRGPRPPQCRPR